MPVRLLREELQVLQEPGSYVGEVVKVMGKKKVLVKVQPEGKYGTLALFYYEPLPLGTLALPSLQHASTFLDLAHCSGRLLARHPHRLPHA